MSLFDEHKAERRARILAAARRLIAERGYDGLTMRDLARALAQRAQEFQSRAVARPARRARKGG